MSHAVFISYSSKEAAVADAVRNALESHGVKCWIAPRDILPGMVWAQAITEGVTRSRVVVLVLSPDSAASGWVAREVEMAGSEGKRVVAFWIRDVTLTDSMSFFLRTMNRVDARFGPFESHRPRLLETVAWELRPVPPPLPFPAYRDSTGMRDMGSTITQPGRPGWPAGWIQPPVPSFWTRVGQGSATAAVIGLVAGLFGAKGCAVYIMIGPLMAILWIAVAAAKSHAAGYGGRTAARATVGLLAVLTSAGVVGFLVGLIVEGLRGGLSSSSP